MEMLRNARSYLRIMKETCMKEVSPECRIFLFGSVARGDYRIDSDVDVLVVVPELKDEWDRSRISTLLHKAVNAQEPFEIHVVTPEEFREWYLRFIDVYEEIK
ncbi:nucleotidyltransferase domain-containing protein [Caldivirga sp. UBA161]|uniref:nucleotidyltransferase domain-containing protein n=1 Tax=Caldivirga sp. UBA161 TaxID=1915569 RepID=UPI0025B7D9CF|nr:nucleotidyltransferase domain-containing protein [Caldivirga sp. UBA161]